MDIRISIFRKQGTVSAQAVFDLYLDLVARPLVVAAFGVGDGNIEVVHGADRSGNRFAGGQRHSDLGPAWRCRPQEAGLQGRCLWKLGADLCQGAGHGMAVGTASCTLEELFSLPS